jgi:glutamate N-acetyltransferase/amino-acid N-acetyltransferase
VLLSKRHLQHTAGLAQAVVVNSGCANACTGTQGMADAETMAREVASALGCSPEQVLVASTGVIGVNLNMGR